MLSPAIIEIELTEWILPVIGMHLFDNASGTASERCSRNVVNAEANCVEPLYGIHARAVMEKEVNIYTARGVGRVDARENFYIGSLERNINHYLN